MNENENLNKLELGEPKKKREKVDGGGNLKDIKNLVGNEQVILFRQSKRCARIRDTSY